MLSIFFLFVHALQNALHPMSLYGLEFSSHVAGSTGFSLNELLNALTLKKKKCS